MARKLRSIHRGSGSYKGGAARGFRLTWRLLYIAAAAFVLFVIIMAMSIILWVNSTMAPDSAVLSDPVSSQQMTATSSSSKSDQSSASSPPAKAFSPPPFDARAASRRHRKDTPLDWQSLDEWHRSLRNIVLIIDFVKSSRISDSWDLLNSIYGRIFDTVAAVSEEGSAQLGIFQARVRASEVPSLSGASPPSGALHYATFPAILKRIPRAEGYLWITDDTLLNYWNLGGANKTKVWFLGPLHSEWRTAPLTRPGGLRGQGGGEGGGDVSSGRRGEEDWEQSAPLKRMVQEVLDQMSEKERNRYLRSISPKSNVLIKAPAAAFYVPHRFASSFSRLLQKFALSGVWADVAVPMSLYALESPLQFDPHALVDTVFLHGADQSKPEEKYSTKVCAFNPWGVEEHNSGASLLKAMSKGDPILAY